MTVSAGVMSCGSPRSTLLKDYIVRVGQSQKGVDGMNVSELERLVEGVRTGTIDPAQAVDHIVTALRAAPFEDLGFARLDTHRHWRQGFPEVVLGVGKTPTQIAAIAERIVAHGQTLLVTRAEPAAYEAVRERESRARSITRHARAITLAQGDVPPGRGTILVVCAGTSDLPVAEEAAVTAELMGNTVDRLHDVGVAGIHRLIREQARLAAGTRRHRGRRHGRRAPERRGRTRAGARHRRSDERRLRRQLRWHRGAARHAQQLRQRRRRRQHRQRIRRRVHGVGDQSPLSGSGDPGSGIGVSSFGRFRHSSKSKHSAFEDA